MARETEIVDLIRGLAPAKQSILSLGMGDDCAVVRPRAGEDLVFTTDFVLEGRHFERTTHRPSDIGHKALARSLSDLAAMGSEPAFCLVSLAVPRELTMRWVKSFYHGLLTLAARHSVALAGGDLAQFDKIVVDVMCCGRIARDEAMLRGHARPGDGIFVTGELGGSAHGFHTKRGAFWKRHLRPEPRVFIGLSLRRLGVRSAIDLSDGLSLDLARLCRESKVSGELSRAAIPLAPGVSLDEALHGGEDYELLFTAPARLKLPKRFGGVPVTRIGTIARGAPGDVRLDGRVLPSKGFDHFA